jgi:hypothetical protein
MLKTNFYSHETYHLGSINFHNLEILKYLYDQDLKGYEILPNLSDMIQIYKRLHGIFDSFLIVILKYEACK